MSHPQDPQSLLMPVSVQVSCLVLLSWGPSFLSFALLEHVHTFTDTHSLRQGSADFF